VHSAQQHGSSFRVFWRSQPRQGASKFALKKRDQSRAPLTKWGFNLSARNMDLSQAKAAFSHRSSCHSSKRSKQINQTTQEALCYVKKGRENTARDCALARHQRPWALAQRKARGATTTTPAHHSHAATAPCPRPQSRHQGTAPRHHVQSRVQKQKAHSRAEHRSSPRAPQAQDMAPRQEGSKTASRAARNKRKQPAFAKKCDAHRAYRCGGTAVRDDRLVDFVLQNNSTAEKGVRGGGRSQGKQRSAAPPASQARQDRPLGNAPPWYVNHAHYTPAPAHEMDK